MAEQLTGKVIHSIDQVSQVYYKWQRLLISLPRTG